jgi:hypothetical protein
MVVVLCVQLYAITQHNHDIASHSNDCVACDLAAMSCGSAPPASTVTLVLSLFFTFSYIIALSLPVLPFIRHRFRPPAQAPPLITVL